MSGCALRRWGSGTSCARPADTPAAAAAAAALAALQAERDRQDEMLWGVGASTTAAATAAPSSQQQPLGPKKLGGK